MIKSGFSPWGEMKTSSPFFKSIWKVLFGNDCIVKFLFPSKIGLTISVVTMQGSPAPRTETDLPHAGALY